MNTFGWIDLLEVLIFWAGIYLILRSLRGTRGLGILKGGVGFILGLYLASSILESQFGIDLSRMNFLLDKLVTVALIAFMIIFQPELRRGLTRMGERPFSWLTGPAAGRSVSPIAEAAGHMSRRRIGALIVIERSVGISGIIESGVPLSAEVTAPLLESIFYPNAPLHDGAVVVRGSRVVAASCLLPLSDSPDLGPEVGTRHRAAVGLTEETDAMVLVVSEQTGRISLAHYGKIHPLRDTRDLESSINEILTGGQLSTGSKEGAADSKDSRPPAVSATPAKGLSAPRNGGKEEGSDQAADSSDRESRSEPEADRNIRIDRSAKSRRTKVRKKGGAGSSDPVASPSADKSDVTSEGPKEPDPE